MTKRKNIKKPLDFGWWSTPFQAEWANTPDEVPIWDMSRGFPIDRSLNGGALSRPASDLEVLRALLEDDSWEPTPPPQEGYPRVVRANYTQQIRSLWRQHDDILNRLMRLMRKDPPDKWTMNAILELNAEVGAVADNTLYRWLDLARHVRAHMEARYALDNSLDDNPYAAMIDETEGRAVLWRKTYGQLSYNPYDFDILACTQGRNSKNEFLVEIINRRRNLISEGGIWTVEETLERVFIAEVPLYGWVQYRIGDIWEPSAEVAQCGGCDNLFLNRRKGKLYCSDACRGRKHESEKRLSTTA